MKRAIAIVLIATQLAGCYAWRPQPIAPDSPPSEPMTLPNVRVRDRAGRTVELAWATLTGDSLEGRIVGRDPVVDTTIDLHDVTEMRVRHVTAAPAAVSAILLGALVAYVALQNCECSAWRQ